jgi:hypothetical protein
MLFKQWGGEQDSKRGGLLGKRTNDDMPARGAKMVPSRSHCTALVDQLAAEVTA